MRRRLIRYVLVGVFLLAGIPVRAGGAFAPNIGESLTYRIYLAGFALGEEQLHVKASKTPDGKPALLFEVSLDSYPMLFRLLDYHEKRRVLWDPEGAYPLAEEGTVTQHRAAQTVRIEFRPAQGAILMTSTRPGETPNDSTLPYVGNTQTNFTLLYYLRTFPWEKGQYRVPLFTGQRVDWYTFEVEAETRPVRVPYGGSDQTYHLFNRELKYDIWFDRGPGRLPLEIRFRAGFGLAQAKLVSAVNFK
ncbi:MAG: DUF3108 domain-containing protein [Bacteroidota bacterium]